jgi:predicted acylesterase/phospholipase RssA
MSSRVALCLNSSFLGFFAHAGFLDALVRLGIRPVAVSGASAGALVAGAYAAGAEPRELVHWLLRGDLRRAFFEWGALPRAFATLLNLRGHTGSIRGHHALALLRERLGDQRIEDCTPPLAIAATDLTRTSAALLREGPLAEAILASGAFPGMFAARQLDGAHYWDGGVANAMPFDHWLDDPQIDTILVHVVENPSAPARSLTMFDAVARSHTIIGDELLRLKTDLARRAGKRLVFLLTTAPRPNAWNSRWLGPRCVELGAGTVAENEALLRSLAP